ncbi:MAG: hypothetical protein H0X30_15525, partial [Anaerolineae bacterium]|nr:hypothetical protein [Anaerolineae bacterium]
MKNLTRFRLFLILLLLIICILMVACQTVLPTATATPISVGMAGTATSPQETPAAAPTEDGAW